MTALPNTAVIGDWRSTGYNRVLSISPTQYSIYTVTAHSCTLYETGSIAEFLLGFDRISVDEDGLLNLHYSGDLTRYRYHRIENFDALQQKHSTPCMEITINFNVFCEAFAENYAFFEPHAVDWPALEQQYRAQLSDETDDNDLLDIFASMIAPLHDSHVYVSTPERTVFSHSVNLGPRQAMQQLFELEQPRVSNRNSISQFAAKLEELLLAPFAASRGPLSSAGNGIIQWCEIDSGIGYISCLRLFGFAATEAAKTADDLPHQPHQCGPFLHEDMAALEDILDKVLNDLADMDAIVIDARINGGGFDRGGLEIANRFSEQRQTAYRKSAILGEDLTPLQAIELAPPAGKACFHKPVYLLISPLTLSAGEVFALCIQALPNGLLLGESTPGILSDNLFHKLPNGWEISLSNEIYQSFEGVCYEGIGVPPDIELPPLTDNLLADLQAGLHQAIEIVKQRSGLTTHPNHQH